MTPLGCKHANRLEAKRGKAYHAIKVVMLRSRKISLKMKTLRLWMVGKTTALSTMFETDRLWFVKWLGFGL